MLPLPQQIPSSNLFKPKGALSQLSASVPPYTVDGNEQCGASYHTLNGCLLQTYIKEIELLLYQSEGSNALRAYQRMNLLSSEVLRLVYRRVGRQPAQRTAFFASMTAQHHVPPNTEPSFSPELLVGFLFPSVGCPPHPSHHCPLPFSPYKVIILSRAFPLDI